MIEREGPKPKRIFKAIKDFFIPWARENTEVEKILRDFLKSPRYGIYMPTRMEEEIKNIGK